MLILKKERETWIHWSTADGLRSCLHIRGRRCFCSFLHKLTAASPQEEILTQHCKTFSFNGYPATSWANSLITQLHKTPSFHVCWRLLQDLHPLPRKNSKILHLKWKHWLLWHESILPFSCQEFHIFRFHLLHISQLDHGTLKLNLSKKLVHVPEKWETHCAIFCSSFRRFTVRQWKIFSF